MKTVLKNHFIPHHGNDYKPHILQKIALSAMVVLIALSFTMANLQALFWISSDWMVSTILPAVIVAETNQERSGAAPTLTRNAVLDYAAQLKAEHMAANEYFSHYSPDGVSPWYWFGQADYGFVHAGENLAIHFNDSSEVVEAWMDSPTHRANILNGDFREIGIGVAEGMYEGYKTIYVVQLFGTPAATQVATTPEPAPVVVEPAPIAVVPTPQPVVAEEVVVTPAPTPTPVPVAPIVVEEVAGAEDEVIAVVEIEPASPVAVAAPTAPVVATATEPDVVEEETPVDTEVVFTEFISTSTGGVPASIDSAAVDQNNNNAPTFAFATQPQFVLQLLYATIGLFVVGALLLSILIEIRRQHPMQVAYGGGLLAAMWALLYIHTAITSGATII